MNARELQNIYVRKWRSENKEKVKAINQRYWEKKSKEFNLKAKGEIIK